MLAQQCAEESAKLPAPASQQHDGSQLSGSRTQVSPGTIPNYASSSHRIPLMTSTDTYPLADRR